MAIVRINQLPDGSGTLSSDDILILMDNPSSGGTTKKISISQLASAIGISGGIGGGNPFDQELNTFNNPTFNNVIVSGSGDGNGLLTLSSSGLKFSDETIQNTAWTGVITASQVSDFNSSVSGLLPTIIDGGSATGYYS